METTSPNRTHYDLAVIGAGPAGLAAAITAAHSGATVLLAERGKLPRHRVCGEFVSAESLHLLQTLLADTNRKPDNGAHHGGALLESAPRISQSRIFLGNRTVGAQIDPAAASIARYDLDIALWNSAVEAGVDAHQNLVVQSVVQSTEFDLDGCFAVTTSAGKVNVRSVIQAAGRWSNLTAKSTAGSSPNHPQWIGVKAHFAEPEQQLPSVSEVMAPEIPIAAPTVDLYFFAGGYCGVQPVELQHTDANANSYGRRVRRVNAAALVRVDTATSILEVLNRHPKLAKRSATWQPLTDPIATSHLTFRTPVPLDGEVMLAGDAAGFVDPFVGDGISLALRSGALAAEALIPFWRGKASLADSTAQYADLYRSRLLPVFRNAAIFRKLLSLPPLLRVPLAAMLQYSPWLTRNLVEMTR